MSLLETSESERQSLIRERKRRLATLIDDFLYIKINNIELNPERIVKWLDFGDPIYQEEFKKLVSNPKVALDLKNVLEKNLFKEPILENDPYWAYASDTKGEDKSYEDSPKWVRALFLLHITLKSHWLKFKEYVLVSKPKPSMDGESKDRPYSRKFLLALGWEEGDNDPFFAKLNGMAVYFFKILLGGVPRDSFKRCENPTCGRWFVLTSEHGKEHCSRLCAVKNEQRKKYESDPKGYKASRRDFYKGETAICHIIGYAKEEGMEGTSSLAVATLENRKWIYRGVVRSGVEEEDVEIVSLRTQHLKTDTPPPPMSISRKPDIQWVKPKLKCKIIFVGYTEDGRLKAPSFKGLLDGEDYKAKARTQRKDIEVREVGRSFGKSGVEEKTSEVAAQKDATADFRDSGLAYFWVDPPPLEEFEGEILSFEIGHGFIKCAKFPNNVFFHWTVLANRDFVDLQKGQKVKFFVKRDAKDPVAEWIEVQE